MIGGGRISAVALLALTGIAVWRAGITFRAQHQAEILYPSPAVSRVIRLSEVNPLLRGTPGDTDCYVFEGRQPGGSLLVLGGTHATEIAGYMTAVLLVETLDVQAGRIFVIPRANASAATHTLPGEGHPRFIAIHTPGGPRRFRYGARYTNPVHQEPDPAFFLHPASPRMLTGREARNLNRVYPGVRDGTLTERVAWSIVELIRREEIDLAFDLHEAPPDRKLVNAMVAPEVSQDVAAEAVIMLQMGGWDIHLEGSSREFRGLSHREWADATNTRSFLTETANPVQGKLRGRTSAELAVTGRDDRDREPARIGAAAVPIEQRIAQNLAALAAVLDVYNAVEPERMITTTGRPGPQSLIDNGLGHYLSAPR